jgi:hypothetical protein
VDVRPPARAVVLKPTAQLPQGTCPVVTPPPPAEEERALNK